MATQEKTKPYGYLLVLRGLAKAAIELPDHPAALRVLCVLADYMGPDGMCRFGQGTVAARLGMSRPAVNKHLRLLHEAGILTKSIVGDPLTTDTTKAGRTLLYMLDLTGLAEARAGQEEIDDRRLQKRVEREGLVTLQQREGFQAFLAATSYDQRMSGDTAKGKAAMVAAERALGFRYEVEIPASADTGYVAYYRRSQIEAEGQPSLAAIEAAANQAQGPEPCDFG
ncbi:helix-turn-helix domain-containing protein [Kaistia defluvii]